MSSASPPAPAAAAPKRARFADPIASGISLDDMDVDETDRGPPSPSHALLGDLHQPDEEDDEDDDDEEDDDDDDMGKTARARLASALTPSGASGSRSTGSAGMAAGAGPSLPNAMRLLYRAEEGHVREYVETIADEDQRERFYAFRRIKFNNPNIKRLTTSATGATTIPKNVPMVMGAVARTYLSEILDLARKSMVEAGEAPNGRLGVHHLREGYRRYHAMGKGLPAIHHQPVRKRLF